MSKGAMGQLHHEDYVQCLKEGSSNIVRMESIRSYEQQLYTVELFKKGLCYNDVKRWICDDGIETKPYGYNPLEDKDELDIVDDEDDEMEADCKEQEEERDNSNDSDEDNGDLELM